MGDHDLHLRQDLPVHLRRVGVDPGAQQLQQSVGVDLLVAARVVGDLLGPFDLGRVDHPRSAAARGGERVDDGGQPTATLRVQVPGGVHHPVAQLPQLQAAQFVQFGLPGRDALLVDQIPGGAGLPEQLIRRQVGVAGDQLFGGLRAAGRR